MTITESDPVLPVALNSITVTEICGLDGFLSWSGTDRRPASWLNIDAETILYGRRTAVEIDSGMLGGYAVGYDVAASLFDEHLWTSGEFSMKPFL